MIQPTTQVDNVKMNIQIDPEQLSRIALEQHNHNEDVPHHLRPVGTQSITLDIPVWILEELDSTALKLKVSRDDLIKVWLGERLLRK